MTHSEPSGAQGRLIPFKWILVTTNLIWPINFGIILTDYLASGRTGYDLRIPLINEITGAYCAGLLIPVIALFWQRYPLITPHKLSRFPMYLFMVVVVGITHTTLMIFTRHPLYFLFDLGSFDPGKLLFRYAFEFQKQIVWIWLVVGGLAWLHHSRIFQHAKLRTLRLQEQLQQVQLDVIKQQINPHFLFNTLNMISEKVYESAEEADRLISALSELLRDSLELGKLNQIPVAQEIEYVKKYLSIMKGRFEDRIEYNFHIPENCNDCIIPPFLLQPIVENSIKHRMEIGVHGVSINIYAELEGQMLLFRIIDESENRIGTLGSTLDGTGTGLSNIKLRLKTLYGMDDLTDFNPLNDRSFQAIVRVPLQLEGSSNE